MSTITKVFLTLVIIVIAIPGLIIEPGPLSEMAAGTALLALWGYGDVLTGGDA